MILRFTVDHLRASRVAGNWLLARRLPGEGVVPMPMTPVEFGKLITDETEKWGKVVRAADIKAE